MTLVNLALTPLFDLLLGPLDRLPPLAGLTILALVTAIAVLLAFKWTADQQALVDFVRAGSADLAVGLRDELDEVLVRYASLKHKRGLLDFDDLLRRVAVEPAESADLALFSAFRAAITSVSTALRFDAPVP